MHRARDRAPASRAARVLAVPLLVGPGVEDHRRRVVDGGDDIRPGRADRLHRFVGVGARTRRVGFVDERLSRRRARPRTPPSSTATRSCPRYSRNQKARAAASSVNSPHTTMMSSRHIPAIASWNAHILVKDAERCGVGVVGVDSVHAEVEGAGDVPVRVTFPAPHVEHQHVIVVVETGGERGRVPQQRSGPGAHASVSLEASAGTRLGPLGRAFHRSRNPAGRTNRRRSPTAEAICHVGLRLRPDPTCEPCQPEPRTASTRRPALPPARRGSGAHVPQVLHQQRRRARGAPNPLGRPLHQAFRPHVLQDVVERELQRRGVSISGFSMMSGGQNAMRIPPPVQARSSTPRRVQASVTHRRGTGRSSPSSPVLDDLDRADEPHAGRVTDDRVLAEGREPLLRVRADPAHVGADVHLVVDIQRLQRDRGRAPGGRSR